MSVCSVIRVPLNRKLIYLKMGDGDGDGEGDAAAQFVVGHHAIALQIVVGRPDRENLQTAHDAEDEECVSTSAASSFYILDQVVPRRLAHGGIDPSSTLCATSTLSGQQPFRQVVPRRFGDAGTNPSSALGTTSLGLQPSSQKVVTRE